jgi:uncharacterized protein (TIGR03437 family)
MNKTIFRWRTGNAGWFGTAAVAAACVLLAAPIQGHAGTVGKVVAIGGHASDLALDEGRGVVYVANYTANRIEVMTLDGNIRTSINVAAQPSSLSLSPDGRFLVIAHFSNFQGGSSGNGLTILDLSADTRQTYSLGAAPLGVAFGIDNKALVVTAGEFLLLDPWTGRTEVLATVQGVTTRTLPQPQGNLPTNIVSASLATSGDGLWVAGSAGVGSASGGGNGQGATTNESLEFVYDVTTKRVHAIHWTWSPPPGPRAVSMNYDGSRHTSGWGMYDRRIDVALNQFGGATGRFEVGTHVFDDRRGLLYAQYEESSTTAAATPAPGQAQQPAAAKKPVLLVLDSSSLAVKERWQLPENTAGKSILNSDSSLMYAISDSGVLIIPIGRANDIPRVVASRETLSFRGNYCDRRVLVQEVTFSDPSGANVDFSLSTTQAGISVSPSTGVTPATVRITVDPTAFQNQKGTVTANIDVKTERGVNLPPAIRVLINNREPDQRGSFLTLAGKLVDLLADPARERFYVLRQDANQVLVFDGGTQTQIATLKTANTPTQMAITFDRRYLLVGHDNAQVIRVYDLETLEESMPIRMPGGHYPRSIGVSARSILVASRVAGPKHKISRVDLAARIATELPTLGVYENDINVDTILVAAPNGGTIFAAQADGKVLLYNANADTFTISRKDFTALNGAYAASSFDQYVINNTVLNSSLVPMGTLDPSGSGTSSGYAFVDQFGIRLTAANQSSPGVIERVDLSGNRSARASRVAEAPLLPEAATAGGGSVTKAWSQIFTRTLAPLYSRKSVVALTQSGLTVLPWDFDAATAPPRIERVVNAADGTGPVAPGGLISIYGANLSPIDQATRQMPLPTALGESCLTVNGVPVPVVYVSSTQINGQMPFQADGNVTMLLRTPGGVSDNFNLTVLPTAPTVFRNAVAGEQRDLPAVYRTRNGLVVTATNPIHRGDTISIYLTGMGRTSPAVETGAPAPDDPLAAVVTAPRVLLGDVALDLESAGLAPGAVGVYQITARVPINAPMGLDVPLAVSQGSGSTAAISVRVVD